MPAPAPPTLWLHRIGSQTLTRAGDALKWTKTTPHNVRLILFMAQILMTETPSPKLVEAGQVLNVFKSLVVGRFRGIESHTLP